MPGAVGIELANWYWKGVRQFVSEQFGISLSRSSCLNWLHRCGAICSAPRGCGLPGSASPARMNGPSIAGTWTVASLATTCPTLPEDTTLETLACVGGSKWRIETEFETDKGDVGLDEYETRSWAGWHHHIAMCLLGGTFLLGLQQDWGGDADRGM